MLRPAASRRWWGHDKGSRFRMGPEFVPCRRRGLAAQQPAGLGLAPARFLEIFGRFRHGQAAGEVLSSPVIWSSCSSRSLRNTSMYSPPRPAQPAANCPAPQQRPGRGPPGVRGAGSSRRHRCWREPDVDPGGTGALYNSYTDVFRFVEYSKAWCGMSAKHPSPWLVRAGRSLLAVYLAGRPRSRGLRTPPGYAPPRHPRGPLHQPGLAHRASVPWTVWASCRVQKLVIPMRGRMLHDKDGPRPSLPMAVPYGSHPFRLTALD